jgi:hypothetical protein
VPYDYCLPSFASALCAGRRSKAVPRHSGAAIESANNALKCGRQPAALRWQTQQDSASRG